MTKVYLESSEGKKILVKRDLLQNLGTLKKLVQNLGCEEDEVIPLPAVPAKILKKVLQWCEHEIQLNDTQLSLSTSPGSLTTAHIVRGDRIEEISSRIRPTQILLNKDKPWKVDNDIWEQEFLNKNKTIWHPLLLVANYLDQRRLSYSISGRVADLIKGKDPEKIRKLFNAPKRSTDLDLISLHSFSTTLTSLSPSLSISSITPENI